MKKKKLDEVFASACEAGICLDCSPNPAKVILGIYGGVGLGSLVIAGANYLIQNQEKLELINNYIKSIF